MATKVGEIISTGEQIATPGETDMSNPNGAPRVGAQQAVEIGTAMLYAAADSVREQSWGNVDENGIPLRMDGSPYPVPAEPLIDGLPDHLK